MATLQNIILIIALLLSVLLLHLIVKGEGDDR
jgi:hypothetical protein